MNDIVDLNIVLQSSGADGALLMDGNGKLLDALDIEYDGNVAAMTNMIIKMVNGLSNDLGQGDIVQINCKSEEGIYVVHRINQDNIICLLSRDLSKIGYIMMALKAVKI